jgi:hypothetical protein
MIDRMGISGFISSTDENVELSQPLGRPIEFVGVFGGSPDG